MNEQEKTGLWYDRLPYGGAPEIKPSDEQRKKKVRRNTRQDDTENDRPKTVLIDRLTGKPYGEEGDE